MQLVNRILTGRLGKPKQIVVFSRDEAKQHEMRLSYLHRKAATDEAIYRNFEEVLAFRIGDIRDYDAVVRAVREAQIVFHAAALKQVPTCEYFPMEAVRTNVLGTYNLIRAVRENDVATRVVVGISTDKAAMPVNVMGMTKALQERLLVEANLGCPETRFVSVRFGNVIASRGSVVPLFQAQIASGGPVTITTKDMTRFLLSLDQAVDVTLHALLHARPGEILVPKAASARVIDLAEVMINDREIEITFTGIRPGEKRHEILVSEEESPRTFVRGDYFVILPLLPEVRASSGEPSLQEEFSSRHVTLEKPDLQRVLQPYLNGELSRVGT